MLFNYITKIRRECSQTLKPIMGKLIVLVTIFNVPTFGTPENDFTKDIILLGHLYSL